MKNINLTPDNKLDTVTDIEARLYSVKKQRDALCYRDEKVTNVTAFNKRQAKIAKLTERESALCVALKKARQSAEA